MDVVVRKHFPTYVLCSASERRIGSLSANASRGVR